MALLTYLRVLLALTVSSGGGSASGFTYYERLASELPNELYVMPGDLMIPVILPMRRYDEGTLCSEEVDKDAFEILFGSRYAAEVINRDNGLLPGTTIGLYMVDDCQREGVAVSRLLQLLSHPTLGPMPEGYSPQMPYPPLGVVGPVAAHTTLTVGHMGRNYGVALVSPNGGLEALTNRDKYPTVFGTIPTVTEMADMLLRILHYFKWNYFTLIYNDRDYGLSYYKKLHIDAPKYNICIAESVFIYTGVDLTLAARKLIDAEARVLVCVAKNREVRDLMDRVQELQGNATNYIFLLSFQGDFSYLAPWKSRIKGSLQVQFRESPNMELREYFSNIWPGNELDNVWMQQYWRAQNWSSNCTSNLEPNCFNLAKIIDVGRATLLHRPISATYALAQAIHDAISQRCPHAFGDIDAIMGCIDPSHVVKALEDVNVQTPTRHFHFSPGGDAPINFTIFQEQDGGHIEIGYFDYTAKEVIINDELLDWVAGRWQMQKDARFPVQECSAPCGPGHFIIQGALPCCWQCFPCRNNEYVSHNGTNCTVCPTLYWPLGEEQLQCYRLTDVYLTYNDSYGLSLTILATVGLVLTASLTGMVVKNRRLRVIKGSGWKILIVILVGVGIAFATVYVHIAKPTDYICVAARGGFHLAFTFIFGPLLVKTNRIFQVFLAASKLSRTVFMGSEASQNAMVLLILIVQVGLTVMSLFLWPAVADSWMPVATNPYVELYCAVPNISLVVCSSFNLLLVLACTVLAFLARNLPDNFNESWYIFLCVCATIFVWVAFFTTYFNAFYVYHRAALLAAALILNGSVVMFALFAPKFYALVFVADHDIKITNYSGSSTRGGTVKQTSVSEDSTKSPDTTESI